MSYEIHDSHEQRRGCGFRKGGGLYMISEAPAQACGILPIMLDRCPTCSHGIKESRGFTWIDPQPLVSKLTCRTSLLECNNCYKPWGNRAGLIWIGTKFYPTCEDFMRESRSQGVSRRIPAVPRGFKIGEHYILLAHRKAMSVMCPDCTNNDMIAKPNCKTCKGERHVSRGAIFTAFCPERVEYVVKGDEPEEKLERMAKKGYRLVRVHPIEDNDSQLSLNTEEEGNGEDKH